MIEKDEQSANKSSKSNIRQTLQLAPFDPKTLELEPFDPARDNKVEKADELIGRILNNKYAVIERVGESAAIVAYKTLILSTNRHVIAKTLKYREPNGIEWLRARAKEQIGKHHPNIADAIDYFETPDGRPFLISEMVIGVTLEDLLKSNEYIEDEHEIAELVGMIGEALKYAHGQKIYHGNLTPRNIFLLESEGNVAVKVSDFGMAREFWQKENLAPSESLDVYQLGLLTYLLATGHVPFENKTHVELMFAPVELEAEKPDPLSYHRSDLYLAEQLSELVEESVEIGEEWRTESVSTFLEGIEKWLHLVEGAQIVRSQIVEEIADLPQGGQRRPSTGERNMRTTIRNMINLRSNLGAQEETLTMKLLGGAAAKGPRRSPAATLVRLCIMCLCVGALGYSIYYISTNHSESVQKLWIDSSRQLSLALHKAPSEDEFQLPTEEVPAKPITTPKSRTDKKHRLMPVMKEPTPRCDPATICAMYRNKEDRFQGNNARNIDAKTRGFRIDYRQFNPDWLDVK